MGVEESTHQLGLLLHELGASDDVRGDELSVRPQFALIKQHVAACVDEPGGERLGQPAAVDRAGLERLHGSGFFCGRIETSPPPSTVAVRFCVESQCRSATSWVLPSCGVASLAPLSCAASVISGFTTRDAPPDGPRDDADALATRLGIGSDGGIGADVADVERAAEDRLDDVGSGIEGLHGHLGTAGSPGEVTGGGSHQSRRMGQVGEEPDVEGRARRRAAPSAREADADGGRAEE